MKTDYWFERFLDKCEPRYGRFAIADLPAYIVFLNAFVYLLNRIKPGYVGWLTLDVSKILQGQIWRLVTYIFIPPETDIILIFFALYLLYIFGKGLESHWGSFRLNCYYLIGMLGTTLIGLCFPNSPLTNAYINTSLFLAFAAVYPDFTVYLFFILPVKVKYLAALTWIGIFFSMAVTAWVWKLLALVSVVNYLLFFWPEIIQNVKLMHRGNRPLPAFSHPVDEPFHRCAACGRTERDDADLDFRVCSTCGREYCTEHLATHTHE